MAAAHSLRDPGLVTDAELTFLTLSWIHPESPDEFCTLACSSPDLDTRFMTALLLSRNIATCSIFPAF